MKVLFYVLASFALFSFVLVQKDNGIQGYWLHADTQKNISAYQRKSAFFDDKGGYYFGSGNKMQVRQNSGWCGTPPITYKNYDGNWKWENDSVIHMKYQFWGGVIEERWEVEYLDKDNLQVRSLSHAVLRGEKNYGLK